MLSLMFISTGGKLGAGYEATQGYMSMMGVPTSMLPVVIATEILGGLAILVGFKTRIAAFLLAGFTLIAAAIFHNNFADPNAEYFVYERFSHCRWFVVTGSQWCGQFSG
ncbi:hypothetical protein GCM10025857_67670 [Alicyclobacillus contaminans]|nr:hypothetical protein GCM10025857_67670 [Alicyclobacillus contaminans]